MTAADVWTLAAHAREQIEHSPIADPHLLARKVALSIPDEHLRDAVDEMIGAYVVGLVSRQRWAATQTTGDGQTSGDTQRLAAVAGDSPPDPGHGCPDAHVRPAGVGGNRWDGIAAVYKRMLDQRVAVEDGEWKFLRDFTADDCAAAELRRRDNAARNLARAEVFGALAAALTEHDRPTVGDLPDDVLEELFA